MARSTAGRQLPGGFVIPASGIVTGADIPPTATFAQQESLVRVPRFGIHRRHHGQGWDTTTGAWVWPTAEEIADAALRSPRSMPLIVQAATMTGSNGFPVVTAGGGNGTFSNTATVAGQRGLDRVTADEWAAKYAASNAAIAQIPGPVLFILWQEPNIPAMGGYYQFQKLSGDARTVGINRYKTAARHVLAAMPPNVIKGWCPTLGTGGDTGTAMLDTYPGDDLIDVIWTDAYRANAPLSGRMDVILNFAKAHAKPVGIAEYGDYPADLPGHLATALSYMKSAAGEEIVFFVPWALSGISDNRFDATAATLTAWRTFFADPYTQHYFLGGGTTDTAPHFLSTPTISDPTPQVDEMLTADPGTVTGSPTPILTYQWQELDAVIAPTSAAYGGGYVNIASADPTNANRIVIGGDVFSSWISEDGLNSIKPTGLGIVGPSVVDRQVAGFVWDTATPGKVFKATKGNVYESTDYGRGSSFTNIGGDGLVGGGSHPRGCGKIGTYLDDGTRVVLHDQTTLGIQKRAPADSGWTEIANYPGGAPQCLVANPANRKQVYVLTTTNCYRVADISVASPTFTSMTGLSGGYELVYDSVNDQMIACQGATIKALANPWSAAASTTWRTLYTGDTNFGYADVKTFASKTWIIAGGNPYNTAGAQSVIRGQDAGGFLTGTGTWDSPRTNWDNVIAGTQLDWYLSQQDGGAQALNGTSQSFDTALLTISPSTGRLVGMVFGHAGIWRTDDFTASNPLWHPAVNGIGGGGDRDVRWDIRDNGRATVAISDHGSLWSPTGLGSEILMLKTSRDGESIAQDPQTHDLFISYDDGTMKRYADSALSTSPPTVSESDMGLAASSDKNSNAAMRDGSANLVLLNANKTGVVQRKVGSGSWTTLAALGTPAEKRNQFAVKHSANLIAFHLKGVGVYVSTDFGASWTQVLASTSADDHAGAVAWDPRAGHDALYYASTTLFRKIVGPWGSPTVTDLTATLTPNLGPFDVGPNGHVVLVTRAISANPTPQVFRSTLTALDAGTPAWTAMADTDGMYKNRGQYPLAVSVNGTGDALVTFDCMGLYTVKAGT